MPDTTPCDPFSRILHDPWLARCRLPAHIGAFVAVIADASGRARILVLDAGVAIVVPSDLARACWDDLCPGDLLCVRLIGQGAGLPVAGSVDALDGSVRLVSQVISGAAL